MPDPPEPGQIRLDVAVETDREPEPRFRTIRVPNTALAFAAAVLLLAAGTVAVLKWHPWGRPAAETAVLEFLNAVQSGEVDRALELAEPDGADRGLLAADVLDTRWKIVTVAQVSYLEDDTGNRSAEVYAEIEAYNGMRVGHRYAVEYDGDQARLHHGVGRLGHYSSSGPGVELNGVPMDRLDPALDLSLLPGLYRLDRPLPEPFEATPTTALVLGDQVRLEDFPVQTDGLQSPGLDVSESGWDTVNGLIEDRLDGCVDAPVEHCPFALPEDERISAAGTWEIASYPVAAKDPHLFASDGVGLVTRVPGEVRIEVTVAGADGPETITIGCDVHVDGGTVSFGAEGDLTLQWHPERTCASATVID
ncbi:hypothetical protein GCM10027447_25220 [Glycomyces halotolerans]